MTDQRRHVPSPADLAARRCGAPVVAAPAPACPALARDVELAAPPYERTRWESEVLQRHLHRIDTLVAFVLAHYAGPGGVLAEDGIQRTDRMKQLTGLSSDSTRLALKNLQKAGLLWRPPSSGRLSTEAARPVTLTVPARRERPPHPGEPQ
jgi:hypothetical protein